MKKFSLALLLLWSASASSVSAQLLKIGSNKQLFLDDFLIQQMVNTKRVLNPAVKVRGNPIIKQDRPWEGNNLHYGTVFYDDAKRQFRMWYTSSDVITDDDGQTNTTRPIVCYATSDDGYSWDKPSLGLVRFEGSTANNILAEENWPNIKGGIFVDPNESDPAKRYKALAQVPAVRTVPGRDKPDVTYVWNLYTSPDAFVWTPHPANPIIRPGGVEKIHPEGGKWAKTTGYQSYLWGPTATVGWDPIRQVYAAHMENCQHRRCPLKKRVIGRAESKDLVEWTEPETIIVPDDRDPSGLQFYSMWTTTYEGFYIGMLWNYVRGPELTIWPQFVFSRDGTHYDRRFRQSFIPLGKEPAFDSVTIYAQQPIVHNDDVFIYYHGTNFRDRPLDEVGGSGPIGAIGLAVVPLDGFVSLENSRPDQPENSQVVTRSFTFSGDRLQINLRSVVSPDRGDACDVRVEILGPDYFRILGYSLDDADPLTESGIAQTVTWNGSGDVSRLAGKPVRLKFYFKRAKWFSFQFAQ